MCIEIIQEKKVFTETIFAYPQKCCNTYQGVFRKEETKGYLNMDFKKVLQMLIMSELASKILQNSIFL